MGQELSWLQGEPIVPKLEGGSWRHRRMMWSHRTGENELSVKSRVHLRVVVCNRTFSIHNFFFTFTNGEFHCDAIISFSITTA